MLFPKFNWILQHLQLYIRYGEFTKQKTGRISIPCLLSWVCKWIGYRNEEIVRTNKILQLSWCVTMKIRLIFFFISQTNMCRVSSIVGFNYRSKHFILLHIKDLIFILIFYLVDNFLLLTNHPCWLVFEEFAINFLVFARINRLIASNGTSKHIRRGSKTIWESNYLHF